jgi:Ca2+-transporting ATPase
VMFLIVVIQVIMTYIGGRVLRTAPLTSQEWLVVVVISLTMIVVDLLRKIVRDQVFGRTDPTNK